MNYIADRNPFQLAPPPDWWLRKLSEFDGDLRVIPSRERPLFWLTRTVRIARVFDGKKFASLNVSPDRQMFATHGLVDVVTMISFTWSEQSLQELLAWLKAGDTWRHEGKPLDEAGIRTALINGGSKFTKAIEEAEQDRDRRLALRQRETIWHATGDGWRSTAARRGSRVLNAGKPRPVQAEGV